jgi:tetratricopeptide (TPR) repeat protein
MAKKRDEADPFDRVFGVLEQAPPGLHDVVEPAEMLPNGLPASLIELYARCDGARIFVDTLELLPSEDVRFDGARWQFAYLDGETISIDLRGKVWRNDASIDDDVCDGTRLDRWLAGQLDAIALLYDHDGEYADEVFDEEGEILGIVREKQLRAQLKRDAAAPAPRWRLALALADQGATEDARTELEQVVADDPAFAWAWLDLARISEKLGEVGGAMDEARMAAEAAEGLRHAQAGYFWAQVARIATRTGDEMVRAEAATKASLLAPALKRAQIDGARERIESGDTASAKGLLELLRAVWPRDLEVLELSRRLTESPPDRPS